MGEIEVGEIEVGETDEVENDFQKNLIITIQIKFYEESYHIQQSLHWLELL